MLYVLPRPAFVHLVGSKLLHMVNETPGVRGCRDMSPL